VEEEDVNDVLRIYADRYTEDDNPNAESRLKKYGGGNAVYSRSHGGEPPF
jgi:hypothetical protein